MPDLDSAEKFNEEGVGDDASSVKETVLFAGDTEDCGESIDKS
jgi:hypothetical protein